MHTDISVRLGFIDSNTPGPDGLYKSAEITIWDKTSAETVAVLKLTMVDVAELMSGATVHVPADRTALPSSTQYARVGKHLRVWSAPVPEDYRDMDDAMVWAQRQASGGEDVEVSVRGSRRGGWVATYQMWTEDPS